MPVARSDILRLYKDLMRYSRRLTLTDPVYFRRRVLTQFKNNRTLNTSEDITFAYQVMRCSAVGPLFSSRMFLTNIIIKRFPSFNLQNIALKHTLDYSKVPKINEADLTEQFIRGSGPGGSAVNKNSNCVVLTHIPTGIVIKCHQSRSQDDNREIARKLLIAKLDEKENGENSVAAQKKRNELEKYKKSEYKKKKIAQLKSDWKKREGLA